MWEGEVNVKTTLTPALKFRASCPPPFGPACRQFKSAPGGFVLRAREKVKSQPAVVPPLPHSGGGLGRGQGLLKPPPP